MWAPSLVGYSLDQLSSSLATVWIQSTALSVSGASSSTEAAVHH